MKKSLVLVCVAGLIIAGTSPLFAGGIINKQNQSADYMRTLSRHAATDYADIAVFNPAGIMKMADGGYAKLDVMYFDKDYSNNAPNNFGEFDQNFGKFSSDKSSTIPAAFAIYKQKKWAGFFAFTIPAGGGELNYRQGNARTLQLADNIAAGFNEQFENPPQLGGFGTNLFNYTQIDSQKLEVKESSVFGFTLGGSYAINDMWSVAAGARYATGKREFKGKAVISAPNPTPTPVPLNDPFTAKLHLEEDADGWAGILGVNFAPNDKLNTALTYISKTKLRYKMDVNKDTLLPNPADPANPISLAASIGFPDGSKRRIDIPALLGFGISYKFLPQFKVDLSYTYYFEKNATIDTFENQGNSWDLGLSAEYTFSPQWKASLGYLRTDIGLDDDQQINEPEEPKLSANTFGAGVVWSPKPAFAITAAGAITSYEDVDGPVETARGETESVNFDKEVWNLSIGFQWKFM
ncbi:MAG: outer membrane protein transport protein [Deltaproteobacteria bacterium]|nr:outer membrane protein transport protein [Deltaproteobacteria bacterium]